MHNIISLLGCRSDLRAKLLLELANNPGKEYTEAELAKILNTTSSAVSKSLRPITEGVLKNVLKTYPVFNNRIYKFEDSPVTKEFVEEIAKELKSTLTAIARMDNSIKELHEISAEIATLEEKLKKGKISETKFTKKLRALEKRARKT